jgi:acetyl/propionyl-CoA carboxylase alpha subunit
MIRKLLRHPALPDLVEVHVERLTGERELRVRFADENAELQVQWTGPHAGIMHLHGRVIRFRAALLGASIQVWVAGRTHVFELVEGGTRRGASVSSAVLSELTAPMPGTVLAIKASPGDEVVAHQPLIVLESMKMEMTLSAPGTGKVLDVLCQVGDLVEMGELLLKLDGEQGDAEVS